MFTFIRRLFKSKQNLDTLLQILELDKNQLKPWIEAISLESQYTPTSIPKHRGGQRILHIPNPALKTMQKKIYKKLLKNRQVHTAAHGFVPARSIITNAIPHTQAAIIIKIDLENFFNHLTDKQVYAYWNYTWDSKTSELLTKLTTHTHMLPQGAPTSPMLSNILTYKMDTRLHRASAYFGANYTRYADDITLSFKENTSQYSSCLLGILAILHDEGFVVNKKKAITILRPHQQMRVTGLVVNQKVQLPRTTRRNIRAMQHYADVGRPVDQQKLLGYLSLQQAVQKQAGTEE